MLQTWPVEARAEQELRMLGSCICLGLLWFGARMEASRYPRRENRGKQKQMKKVAKVHKKKTGGYLQRECLEGWSVYGFCEEGIV